VILADTSVWIDHLRSGVPELASLLERGEVLHHPFVRGELACGNLRNRRELLDLLGRLPVAPVASDDETLEFIEKRALMGRGIGYVDVHILAAVALAGTARLWTRDRRLDAVAGELGLSFTEEP
jgi:predicted nucleic acid-binding protein